MNEQNCNMTLVHFTALAAALETLTDVYPHGVLKEAILEGSAALKQIPGYEEKETEMKAEIERLRNAQCPDEDVLGCMQDDHEKDLKECGKLEFINDLARLIEQHSIDEKLNNSAYVLATIVDDFLSKITHLN